MPRLTVLLPTLNCEAYVRQALDSLAAQTVSDFHVLVLDGGSSDNTLDIVRERKDLSLEIVECGQIGLGRQLNTGLDRVSTPYAARMDADDISAPGRFRLQLALIETAPRIAILGGQIELLVGQIRSQAGPLPPTHDEIRRSLLAGFTAFCHPTILFRTAAAKQCGGYAIEGRGEDLDFYLRMTEVGLGHNLSQVIHSYRLHTESASFSSFSEIQRNYDYALACARARLHASPEPTQAEHAARWNSRGSLARIVHFFQHHGAILYRRSRIRIAQGQRLSGIAGVALSALVRPQLLYTRVQIQFSSWRNPLRAE
jgi:glycosyltransferase involved in cell wall biosynthesis